MVSVSEIVQCNKLSVMLTGAPERQSSESFLIMTWDDEPEKRTMEKGTVLARL
jgi:hypothetical protein